MNRIEQLFQNKSSNILSIYFTAGYPKVHDTVNVIEALEKGGADMAEIGMPFSDPLADGPVIQESSQTALENGMSISFLFEQLQEIRKSVSMPLILMGYLNPVMQYGMERFCRKVSQSGIDGIILPDLPVDIYEQEYKHIFEAEGVSKIFLITPETSDQRIKLIDKLGSGFTYLVSASSTTGAKEGFQSNQIDYFKRIQQMNLTNPSLIGFGISNHLAYRQACEYANGAIIGSAFIKHLSRLSGHYTEKELENRTAEFIGNIKAGPL